jgi:hypothetical protein
LRDRHVRPIATGRASDKEDRSITQFLDANFSILDNVAAITQNVSEVSFSQVASIADLLVGVIADMLQAINAFSLLSRPDVRANPTLGFPKRESSVQFIGESRERVAPQFLEQQLTRRWFGEFLK